VPFNRFAGQAAGVLTAIKGALKSADQAVGGWLPGGGVPSPITRALRGASDSAASGAMNALPDRVNLFGRYVTGLGNKGLALDRTTLNSLRAATEQQPVGKRKLSAEEGQRVASSLFDMDPGMEQHLRSGASKFKGTPLGEAILSRLQEMDQFRAGKLTHAAPQYEILQQHGPGIPVSGPVNPYANPSIGKDVTQTLGRYTAEVGEQGVRIRDRYDMQNEYEDPDLISGKIQPRKAINEIRKIWDPTLGMKSFGEESERGNGYSQQEFSQAGKSATASPMTRLGRAVLYALPVKPSPYEIDVVIPWERK